MSYQFTSPPMFPRMGFFRATANPGTCSCGKPALGTLEIEVSMFRGQNKFFNVCRECRTLARENTTQFLEGRLVR